MLRATIVLFVASNDWFNISAVRQKKKYKKTGDVLGSKILRSTSIFDGHFEVEIEDRI